MHDQPNAIRNEAAPMASGQDIGDEGGGNQNGGSLADVAIPREQPRRSDQRRESRFPNVVERASIVFRGKTVTVKVVNVSGSGVMIDGPIEPNIGEVLALEFEGFDSIAARVRWVRKGSVGLDVGEGTIELSRRAPVGDYGRRGRRPPRRKGRDAD